ncbi:hypothetical protein FNU76_10800 [Chitinimonas arctica]|uniref:Uncharacterized protein n=1 Tax=Chitinimonas arctica TaxID=2594795 RepID=A0A516SF79_9NEIS|nr:hypothetical protein [Chitinimonas arctica]QDQ26814.1 hypothetical protein FNU76_10800 [Chitinimonas arctica]
MRPKNRIDHFLPVRFSNGSLVKQFSKPCLKCGQMLHAREMHGIARLLDDHLALAAIAHCPACHGQFGISCVIDRDKRVRRVSLPAWLFMIYLRALPVQAGEQAAHEQAVAEVAQAQRREQEQAVRPVAVEYPRADTAIGRYADKPIPAYIVVHGAEVPFDRVEPDGRVTDGEYLLDGCFVYKAAQS